MEAAIVLPIIILVVVTMVMIITFFYTQVQDQSRMHMFLRANAHGITEKTIYLDDIQWNGSVHCKKQPFGGYAYGKGYLIMENKGILARKGIYVEESTSHTVDGVKYIRYITLVKGTLLNEE